MNRDIELAELDKQWMESYKDFMRNYCGVQDLRSFAQCGVYIIGDFYIGRSARISKRIVKHMRDAITERHCNKRFQEIVLSKLICGEKIKIKIIANDPSQEDYMINQYLQFNFPLINQLKNKHTDATYF